MKSLLSIIVGLSITLSGLPPTFAFSMQPVNRWPYSFGDRYKYDNTGSSWNYDRENRSNRPHKYWQPRFEYDYSVKGHSDQKFQDLIEHLSENPYHKEETYQYGPFCR